MDSVKNYFSAQKNMLSQKVPFVTPPTLPSLTPPTILPSHSFPPFTVTTKIKISQRILTVATVQDVAGFDTELFVAPTPRPLPTNKQSDRDREL